MRSPAASRCAASTRSMSYCVATSRSSRLNWLVTFPFQKYPVFFWSVVRTELSTRPYAFVSLKSFRPFATVELGRSLRRELVRAVEHERVHRTQPRRLRERERAWREHPGPRRDRSRAGVALRAI